jgi:peptidyl-prolyl cis-trans isomerase D
MLDIMRRRKGAVRIVLSIVVVSVAGSFALALYGVWGGALSGNEQGAPNWIASVDGEQIPVRLYQRQRGLLIQDFRERLGGQQVPEETLTRLAEQQALGILLGTYLAQREAERAGLRVTQPEVSDAIVNTEGFQRNGQFVGAQQYRRQLAAFGMQPAEFEQEVAVQLAANKLRGAISALARVDEAQIEKKYHDEVERVDVNYVLFSDTTYADARTPGEAELRSHFSSHPEKYMTPEGRRAAFVLFDREAKAASSPVPDDRLRDYYEKNKGSLYTHKEQRRASHILVKVPPDAAADQDATARDKVDQILQRLRGGEDFATVARQSSDDAGSAASGGDLGFFERGRMVKEFDDAAFALQVGAISDVVKSPFGYHIIKATDSRPAGEQPFEEVKDDIRRTLSVQTAQEEIRKAADEFAARLASQEASFDKTAAAAGVNLEDTGFFVKGEPAGRLGRLPQVDDAVFALKPGGVSAPVAVPQGLAIFSLTEIRAPQPAPFDTVRAKVESDLKIFRARGKARGIASEIVAGSGSLGARAEKRKLEVKSFPAVSRMQPLPPLTDAIKSAAFTATPGSVLGPFESEDGLVVIEVTGKSPKTPEEAAKERASLRLRLLDEERSSIYQTFISHLQKNAKIDINDTLLQQGRTRG